MPPISSWMGDLRPVSGHFAVLLLAAAVALGGWTSCHWGEQRVLPPPLVGTWTTEAPRYRNRSLEIHPGRVVLAERGHPIDQYRVEGFRSWAGEWGQVYELRCVTGDGLRDTLRLTYALGPPPYVIVGRAPARWLRRGGP